VAVSKPVNSAIAAVSVAAARFVPRWCRRL
jgi:hypothetical protein